MTMTDSICDCCAREAELAGVASSSLGPMSLAYCKDCVVNHAEPLYLVEIVIEINGLSNRYLDTTVFYNGEYVPYATVLVYKQQRKIFLLHGWGRALCCEVDRRRSMDYICKQRAYDGTEERDGGRWGVAVHEDEWAGLWQRINFRVRRAHYAFGMSGIMKEYVWKDDHGFVEIPKEVLRERNVATFQRSYRAPAHAAKMRFNKPIRQKIDQAAHEETMREIY